jgi:hypothetical protein
VYPGGIIVEVIVTVEDHAVLERATSDCGPSYKKPVSVVVKMTVGVPDALTYASY